LREHGQERTEELESKLVEPRGAPLARRNGDGGKVSAQHRRAANVRERNPKCVRERLLHHGFERSLPELAHQKRAQETLLGFGREREKLEQERLLALARAGARDGRDFGKPPL